MSIVTYEANYALNRLKEISVGPPKRYLGADKKTGQLKYEIQCWMMSPDSYVREAISNVEVFDGT